MFRLADGHMVAERGRGVWRRYRRLPASAGGIILHPGEGRIITDVSEFGIAGGITEERIREQSAFYAKKLLRRLPGASS